MSCLLCNSLVQFPGILPSDTPFNLNGMTFPVSPYTIDDLVNANPQFFYHFGLSGVKTLHTWMVVEDIDLIFAVKRSGSTIPVTAVPAKDHPIHAPK